MKYLLMFILSFTIVSIDAQVNNPLFPIGTKWTYEKENFVSNKTNFVTFEIVDTTSYQGEKVWLLLTPDGEKMLNQDDGKVWIYQEEVEDFQLTYDFKLESETEFQWGGICPPSIDGSNVHTSTMKIDSIVGYELPDQSISSVQYVSYTESTPIDAYGTWGRKAIKNIGFANYGLGLSTGYLICDNMTEAITKLRCFESPNVVYNFVGYDCDSTWFLSNTNELEKFNITLFPNPSNGVVNISGVDHFDGEVIVADVTGKELMRKTIQFSGTYDVDLSELQGGTYVIQLQEKDRAFEAKKILHIK